MTLDELKTQSAPFDVVDKKGKVHRVKGFSQNDPLGVGGGIFPDMPCVFWEGGGWNLVEDFLRYYELPKKKRKQRSKVV